jgi:Ran-binding protein 1
VKEVIYAKRSKLFIYGETLLDKGTGKKSWRERGIGEARLLRHREHQRIRLLVRQEKTMKVIANQAVDPRVKLEPNVGSDRSWVWSAFDFAEGVLEEVVFAIRFSDSETANDFKAKYEECQKEMGTLLAGSDNPGTDGGAAGNEAAELLSGLSTTDKDKEGSGDA